MSSEALGLLTFGALELRGQREGEGEREMHLPLADDLNEREREGDPNSIVHPSVQFEAVADRTRDGIGEREREREEAKGRN